MNHNEAIEQLRQLEQQAQEAARRGELIVANQIAEEAREAAPGSLPSKIFVTQNETSTTIVGGDDLSAYVEFGTGNFARVYVSTLPVEAQEEAIKFFVSGKGHGSPKPFFFPAIFRNIPRVLEEVDSELQKLAK